MDNYDDIIRIIDDSDNSPEMNYIQNKQIISKE